MDERFPPQKRLLASGDFKRVLRARPRASSERFQVYAASGLAGEARLGLTVPKKLVRRAVDRAYARRLVREVFRRWPGGVTPQDIVVRIRSTLKRGEGAMLMTELRGLFDRCVP